MHPAIQAKRSVLADLKRRRSIATADLYQMIGIPMPVTSYRYQVRPAGRDFFHVVDSHTGKVAGFRRGHNAACALAKQFEQQ